MFVNLLILMCDGAEEAAASPTPLQPVAAARRDGGKGLYKALSMVCEAQVLERLRQERRARGLNIEVLRQL